MGAPSVLESFHKEIVEKLELEIKRLEVMKPRCDNCVYWRPDGYASGERRECKGLNRCGQEMFSNEGCSNDFIYCTAPDFFCGLFE